MRLSPSSGTNVTMRIIKAYPPIWSKIAARFPYIKGKQGILYAWGDRLFNPSGIKIGPAVIAHEEVHGERQCGDCIGSDRIYEWWDRYLNDDAFRLDEEVRAHHAEWAVLAMAGAGWDTLEALARRLSSPLYGNMIGIEEARMEIINGRS